jgi:hypothetical protein
METSPAPPVRRRGTSTTSSRGFSCAGRRAERLALPILPAPFSAARYPGRTREAYNQLSPGPAEAKGDPPSRAASSPSSPPWGLAASAAGVGFASLRADQRSRLVELALRPEPRPKARKGAADALRRARR